MDKSDLGSLIYTYDLAAGEALGKRENHTPRIEAPPTAKAGPADHPENYSRASPEHR